MTSKTIDLHNHVIPMNLVQAISNAPERYQAKVEVVGSVTKIIHKQGYAYPLFPEFIDVEAKIESMDRRGIDIAAISGAPTMYYYWADRQTGIQAAQLMNDGIAEMVAQRPDRLRGMASLPLSDPEASVQELDRVVQDYGFKSVSLGTVCEGVPLSDDRYRPLLRRAQELGVFIFAHPYFIGDKCGMEPYYLTNLVGNPLETTMMVSHLMFSGAMDECKGLNILLAHGGGFVPYQIGRLAHGYAVRPEPKMKSASSPLDLIKRFYFDTITHHPAALRYLIDLVGADRIAIGTDAPFDMGLDHPVKTVDAIPGLTPDERHWICCGTAQRLFKER